MSRQTASGCLRLRPPTLWWHVSERRIRVTSGMIRGSLFEQDFLVRALGALAQSPDVALTELVANAWDAGASCVDIVIPEDQGTKMSVKDDGCGMTPDQFRQRWMTLGYDRVKHQGASADFPPDRADWKRRAFGRNGVGRHGLLCFADEYEVETTRDGEGGWYLVRTSEGKEPFVLVREQLFEAKGHGSWPGENTRPSPRSRPAARRPKPAPPLPAGGRHFGSYAEGSLQPPQAGLQL